jgi:8-oxo-dGTP pyrophosphatase MutT (NUDIX family)
MQPQAVEENPALPYTNFDIDQSLDSWNLPAKEWLETNNKHWDGLTVAALVFNEEDKILLVQRASHESMANKWEIPGGGVDQDDPSILYAAARELWEESGLVAKRLRQIYNDGMNRKPGFVFPNRTGRRIFCRFSFGIDVTAMETVKLNPKEHQNYHWASEQEVRTLMVGDRGIQFTHRQVQMLVLEAFSSRNSTAKEIS